MEQFWVGANSKVWPWEGLLGEGGRWKLLELQGLRASEERVLMLSRLDTGSVGTLARGRKEKGSRGVW